MSVFGVILIRILLHSGRIRRYSISPYSVRIRENTDQKNTEYGHFSRSDLKQALENYKFCWNSGMKQMAGDGGGVMFFALFWRIAQKIDMWLVP